MHTDLRRVFSSAGSFDCQGSNSEIKKADVYKRQFLKGIFQEAANGIERFDLAVGSLSRCAERRQQVQTRALSRKVPCLAGAEVVHQGLVVILRDDADLVEAGVHHVGEGEVCLLYTSRCV